MGSARTTAGSAEGAQADRGERTAATIDRAGHLPAGTDSAEQPRARPSEDPSRTPLELAPEAPANPPVVTGRRTPQGVLFTWRAPDRGQTGDTWEWRRPAAGTGDRTTATRLTVAGGSGRTCLQVRLIRGSFASPWTEDRVP